MQDCNTLSVCYNDHQNVTKHSIIVTNNRDWNSVAGNSYSNTSTIMDINL